MNPLSRGYAQWISIPAPLREPIKSAVVSVSLGFWTAVCTLLGSAVQDGSAGNPIVTLQYLDAHAWGAFIGFLIASGATSTYRASQAQIRVANTVHLNNGISAVISSSKPGAK